LIVQLENALHANGFHDGLPYWDWTLPMTELPSALAEENYQHPKTGQSDLGWPDFTILNRFRRTSPV